MPHGNAWFQTVLGFRAAHKVLTGGQSSRYELESVTCCNSLFEDVKIGAMICMQWRADSCGEYPAKFHPWCKQRRRNRMFSPHLSGLPDANAKLQRRSYAIPKSHPCSRWQH